MSWIETIAPEDATEPLRELYEAGRDPHTGSVDHILQIHSLAPAGLAAHLSLYEHVMRPTATLRKAEREMIAVVVSVANGCHY